MNEPLKGIIHAIFETQQVSQSFSKREFILKTQDNPQYEQYLKIEFTQDKCSILDNYRPGQEVNVHVNLRGRLWQNKEGVETCFNTIQAWKIEAISQEGKQAYQEASKPYQQPPSKAAWVKQEADQEPMDDDDLPF